MADGHAAGQPRVLVVEDEMIIALGIEDLLDDLGFQLVGPAARVDAAVQLASQAALDVAILDVNIRGGTSYPVADVLAQRGIPFLFCSGYGDWALEERYRDRPRLTKPFSAPDLASLLRDLLGVGPNAADRR